MCVRLGFSWAGRLPAKLGSQVQSQVERDLLEGPGEGDAINATLFFGTTGWQKGAFPGHCSVRAVLVAEVCGCDCLLEVGRRAESKGDGQWRGQTDRHVIPLGVRDPGSQLSWSPDMVSRAALRPREPRFRCSTRTAGPDGKNPFQERSRRLAGSLCMADNFSQLSRNAWRSSAGGCIPSLGPRPDGRTDGVFLAAAAVAIAAVVAALVLASIPQETTGRWDDCGRGVLACWSTMSRCSRERKNKGSTKTVSSKRSWASRPHYKFRGWGLSGNSRTEPLGGVSVRKRTQTPLLPPAIGWPYACADRGRSAKPSNQSQKLCLAGSWLSKSRRQAPTPAGACDWLCLRRANAPPYAVSQACVLVDSLARARCCYYSAAILLSFVSSRFNPSPPSPQTCHVPTTSGRWSILLPIDDGCSHIRNRNKGLQTDVSHAHWSSWLLAGDEASRALLLPGERAQDHRTVPRENLRVVPK